MFWGWEYFNEAPDHTIQNCMIWSIMIVCKTMLGWLGGQLWMTQMVQPDFNPIKHPWKCPSRTHLCGSADKNVRISPNPGVRRGRINAVTENYFYLLAPISPGISGPTVFQTEAVWIVSFPRFFLSPQIFSPHPCHFCISQPSSCNCLTFDSSPSYFVFQHFTTPRFFSVFFHVWLQSAELVFFP